MYAVQVISQRPWFAVVVAIYGSLGIFLTLRRLVGRNLYHQKRTARSCQPPPTNPDSARYFGLPLLRKIVKAKRERRVPGIFCSIFDDTGFNVHTVTHSVFGKHSYWTRDAGNVKSLLSTGFKDWRLPDARVAAFERCWGGGIFGADGHQWEHSRALLRPAFNRGLIHDTEVLERHVQNLIKRIPDGDAVNLGALFPLFTMDIGIELFFNDTVGCLDPVKADEGEQFASSFDYVMKRMSTHLSAPVTAYLPDSKLRRSVDYIFDFTDKFVQRALQSGELHEKQNLLDAEKGQEKYSFITELSKAMKSPTQLRGELLSIMVAGRDTTAGMLGILWWHISWRDDIAQNLRDEIAFLGGGAPSVKELKGMKYLGKLMNEVLRLYPINPINSRTARCDTTLPRGGGSDGSTPVFVAKGQTVIFSSLALHRRKDIWGEDAQELNPERWDSIKPSIWEYIPFGGGPRVCLGQQLALLEAGYATVRILQHFAHIEPMGDERFVENFAMTLTSGGGCEVRLSR